MTYNGLDRFRLLAYNEVFAMTVRELVTQVKKEFGLTGSESERTERLTGTHGWSFEVGGAFAVLGLNLGLKSEEGAYFPAGLWDADGTWTLPDESRPFGRAVFFGGWHAVYLVKRNMKQKWNVATGRMYVATKAGRTSKIGNHTVATKTNVYGTIVKSRSMKAWIEVMGSKMILKGTPSIRSPVR